jgi:hypothetical protein
VNYNILVDHFLGAFCSNVFWLLWPSSPEFSLLDLQDYCMNVGVSYLIRHFYKRSDLPYLERVYKRNTSAPETRMEESDAG